MNEDKFRQLIGREEITPKRLLNSMSNPGLDLSTFYLSINDVLEKIGSSFKDTFGDIIFTKYKMEELYVEQRDDPFYYLSDDGRKIPVAMNNTLKQLYTDNYFVFKNKDEEWQNISNIYDYEIEKFMKNRSEIGKPEASVDYILNIVYPSSRCRIERIFIIIGGIGCGKTTFITRYLSKNLNVSSLFLDFNFIMSLKEFHDEILYKELKQKIIQVEGDKIGDFEFRKGIFEKKIKESFDYFKNPNNTLNKKKLTNKLQEWFEDNEVFVDSYLYYKSEKGNFLLIFDNIDLHPNDNQTYLYEFSKNLVNKIQLLKILITMREYSFGYLQQHDHGTLVNQPILHITSPDTISVIKKRISLILELIVNKKISIQIESSSRQTPNFKLEISETEALINNILKPLLLQKSLFFLISISNGSIKLVLANILKFFSSPYLMNTKLFKRIFKESVVDDYQGARISFDEFVQILLLGNYDFYEQRLSRNHITSFLNLYKTQTNNLDNECFLLQRIIDYSLKHWETQTNIKKSKLIEVVTKALSIAEKKVLGCLDILLKSGTLESPDGIDINSLKETSHIFPTRKAWYYSHRLSKLLTYIRLIQNDLLLDFEHEPHSYIETLDIKEISNYILFIDWIRRIENKELASVIDEDRVYYLQVIGEKPLCLKVFKSFITRLLELKEKRVVSKRILYENKLKILGLFQQIKKNITQARIQPDVSETYLYQIESKVNRLLI